MLDLEGTIEAGQLASGQLVVSARGPLDERVAGTFRDTLVPLAAADAGVLLDLVDAHGVDDATFAIVARAARIANGHGTSLQIVTQSPSVLRLVEEAGIGDIVRLYPTLRDAIEHD